MPRKNKLTAFIKSMTNLDYEAERILENNLWGLYIYSSGGDQMGPIERAIKEGKINKRFKGQKAQVAVYSELYDEDSGHWAIKVKGPKKSDSWAWIGDGDEFRYESWNEAKMDADFFNEWASN